MSAIQFPNSPTVGQQITASGVVYEWDGTKWLAIRELAASGVSFSNAAGGLSAANVQAAIDQIIPSGGKVGKARLPAGSILQVVQGATSSEVIVTTNDFTDTGLTATITPRATDSKILVLVDQSVYSWADEAGSACGVRLLRGSTVIFNPLFYAGEGPYDIAVAAVGSGRTYTEVVLRTPIQILDSPNTTSPVTYKTQGRRYGAGGVIFQAAGTGNNASSRIILMEVAG
jgi:hypothetical protein